MVSIKLLAEFPNELVNLIVNCQSLLSGKLLVLA